MKQPYPQILRNSHSMTCTCKSGSDNDAGAAGGARVQLMILACSSPRLSIKFLLSFIIHIISSTVRCSTVRLIAHFLRMNPFIRNCIEIDTDVRSDDMLTTCWPAILRKIGISQLLIQNGLYQKQLSVTFSVLEICQTHSSKICWTCSYFCWYFWLLLSSYQAGVWDRV